MEKVNDLISRSALLAKAEWEESYMGTDGFRYVRLTDVLDAPAVEAEPVVHAHWEKFRHPSGTHGIRCSHCQTTNGRKSNYCPECGAIMDEKVFEPTPIGKLLFSMRVHKRLKSAGILTMEQLAETDKQTLHNIEGLGKQSILEIEEKLAEWQKERNKNG